MNKIGKILIANRGEIALRVMRTCRRMGIESVAVYSDADRYSPHVKEADEAVCIGPAPSGSSYLNPGAMLRAAGETGADAIHPGYGFLSENADFASLCRDHGVLFIGPSPQTISSMGSKVEAKSLMEKNGVRVIPGYYGEEQSSVQLVREGNRLGFPLVVKPSAGGGGKAMRVVRREQDLKLAIEESRRQAESIFADGTLLLECFLEGARHIEFQILGDQQGKVIHCFERDCSIQRRYQKIIEESPAQDLAPELRSSMGEAAVAAGEAVGYIGAGTVEFLLAGDGSFYFLEMNTRLQVEHPVTEMITGLDLVEWQIRIARGETIPFNHSALARKGHAIECRIYAEDPENGFLPSTGRVEIWRECTFPGTRSDCGIESGSEIGVHYDPMLAKIITHGEDRKQAILRMILALENTVLLGVQSNRLFLLNVLRHPEFQQKSGDTEAVECGRFTAENGESKVGVVILAAMLWHWSERDGARKNLRHLPSGWRNSPDQPQQCEYQLKNIVVPVKYRAVEDKGFEASLNGREYEARILEKTEETLSCEIDSRRYVFFVAADSEMVHLQCHGLGDHRMRLLPRFKTADVVGSGDCTAPLSGTIRRVMVESGASVQADETVVVIESMKMEHSISAGRKGQVREVLVTEKMQVEGGAPLIVIDPEE